MTRSLERHVWNEIKQNIRVRSFKARSGQGDLNDWILRDVGITQDQLVTPIWSLFS